jgi:sirohydrochlorin cobaltochelatase
VVSRSRREPFHLGELRVEFDGQEATIHGPSTGAPEAVVACEPTALVEWTRFDDRGGYRPLTGARNMRHDWRTTCEQRQLDEALDAIYPVALHHMAQWKNGTLTIIPLEQVLARQSGRYEGTARLSEEARRTASDVLCGRCVRIPVWRGDSPGETEIPCPEPCSVLVALCREAALWEEERPEPAKPDEGVQFAEFETPGNAVREDYLEARFTATAHSKGEH